MNTNNPPPGINLKNNIIWLDVGLVPNEKSLWVEGREYVWVESTKTFWEAVQKFLHGSNVLRPGRSEERFEPDANIVPVPYGAYFLQPAGQSSSTWLRDGLITGVSFIASVWGAVAGVWGAWNAAAAGTATTASSATASTTAASSAASSGAAMTYEWGGYAEVADAAVASNTVVSEPSFWDRLTGIGERALEYGVKQAISKEIFGDNQQPISTQATASQTPLNNALPQRGFASSVPYYKPASDMQPFIWLAGGFALVLVLILGLSRR